jgi:hypothetical protein
MCDANGSKAVLCATGPACRALVGSWWRPAPGWPLAVAAPRGWQACGGVPRRQAACHRGRRRGARCATATSTGPGHADPRSGQILRAGLAVAARQPPGGAGDLADRRPTSPPPLRPGPWVLTSMRSRHRPQPAGLLHQRCGDMTTPDIRFPINPAAAAEAAHAGRTRPSREKSFRLPHSVAASWRGGDKPISACRRPVPDQSRGVTGAGRTVTTARPPRCRCRRPAAGRA